MKKLFTCLAILFTILLFSNTTKSAHIIGGVMTYKCLGNDNYQITLKGYRDCQGGGAGFDGPFNGAITLYNSMDLLDFTTITLPDPIISEILPTAPSPCLLVPPGICVEEGIYTFDINLPLNSESYFLVYQRCCRNNTISNILDPNETGATFFVEITGEAQSGCNSSPEFNFFPPIVICANEELIVDHSATDLDGDSLVYELCSPLKGGGTAGWISPGSASDFNGTNPDPDAPPPYIEVEFIGTIYTPTNPMGGSPPISIDAETGILSGIPETIGQFVVGVCVKEYRDGNLLSTVQRDFQFNVKDCPVPLYVDFVPLEIGQAQFSFANSSLNATSYEWDFGDGNTSDFESPTHVYSQSGDFEVKLTGYDANCNLVDEVLKTVSIIVQTNVDDLDKKNTFSVFPNPNSGDFYIRIKNTETQDFLIEILDLNGKRLNDIYLKDRVGETIEPIQLKKYPKGVYFLKMKTEGEIYFERFLIQ